MPTEPSGQLPAMLPREVRAGAGLGAGTWILYPAAEKRYARLAARLADAIEARSGGRPEMAADCDLLPERASTLPAGLRAHSLVLLGNLNNNRAIFPLYARYYCADDAIYPGAGGHDLRTLFNPYGSGANVLLAGGSDFAGVERSVERLIDLVRGQPAGERVEIPFLLDVALAPELARGLAQWPETPLDVEIPLPSSGHTKALGATEGLLRAIGAYGSLYAWMGDRRYGVFAARCLESLNDSSVETYGDWHYLAERFLRALPWLIASGLVDADEAHRTDQLLLGTLLGTQHMWWRMRSGDPPLGHRHQGKGTYEFLLAARYLSEQGNPNPAARQLLARWIDECRSFMDGLASAEVDDQDDESTLNNLATLTRYAFGEERLGYFESGAARRVAERAIALHDNLGAGAGQGGYAEGQPGAAYYQQEATTPVAAAAFYYHDSQLKWILNHLPNLRVPLRLGFLGFTPVFMHTFATGEELPEEAPAGRSAVEALPVPAYQYRLNQNPPEHYEPAGHSVNARETWMQGEGIDRASLPVERVFNKLVFRESFQPEAAYLLLQGYQGGFRWQGHLQAANCIVRFSQAGHIFLAQNTGRHSIYHKNGVFVNNGSNAEPLPPFAEHLAHADHARVAASATRLPGDHGVDWTRHIFWSKAEHGAAGSGETDLGFFVVVDSLDVLADGVYSLVCSWRTPGFARLEGNAWRAEQGGHRFTLHSGHAVKSFSAVEEGQEALAPTVLRQTQTGAFRRGERCAFQNVFYVRERDAAAEVDLRRLSVEQALVRVAGQPVAWIAAGGAALSAPELGLEARALSAWATAGEILCLQTTALALRDGRWKLSSDHPVGVALDLRQHTLALALDGPGADAARVLVETAQERFEITISGSERSDLSLPASLCEALAAQVERGLQALNAPVAVAAAQADAGPDLSGAQALAAQWSAADWTPVPERIRDLTVQADPPSLDGYADQLVDGVLPEMRETWRQWPKADRYEITLRFPEETAVEHVRIVGDSDRDPTLHSYQPLPEGIRVTASSDGFLADEQVCPLQPQAGHLVFRRYRDVTDRMEFRQAAVGRAVRHIRVRAPAPPGDASLVLHEIEVYGQRKALPPMRQLAAVDLDGNGRESLLAVNAAGELRAFSPQGDLLWKRDLPGAPSHLSCHDLDGQGKPSICIGLPDGELRILDGAGELVRSAFLPERFKARNDSHFGWLHTINALAVWQRDARGRAALAVGGYASVAFLDPELNLIGHSWADGAWQTDILVAPGASGAPGSLWVRNGWNHGLCVYEAIDSFEPSGEVVVFGGVRQPMFRALRKVIPFVTGGSLAFQRLGEDGILAAAEMGVGVLSAARRAWLWKREGGAPLTACLALGEANDGVEEVLISSADGYLTFLDGANGTVRRCALAGAPVAGLAWLPEQGLLAAGTREGLRVMDREGRLRAYAPGNVERVARLGDDRVVTAEGGALKAYRLSGGDA